jgi:hypothetical protein
MGTVFAAIVQVGPEPAEMGEPVARYVSAVKPLVTIV